MPKNQHDTPLRLVDIPVLTSRRACVVADCSRSTLQRTGPKPIGRRGRTFIYDTAAILRWLSSGLEPASVASTSPARTPRAAAPPADVLERLAAIRRGGR